ncbi:MAG: cache domain-containing protein [Anaerolineales bacterium]
MSKQASDDNMQNRINNMFSNQEPPSYASAREVDAMKARINELEVELAHRNELKQVEDDRKEKENPFSFITPLKKWLVDFFSSKKETVSPTEVQANTILRILFVAIISVLVSLPFYIYLAIKINSWQTYVIAIMLIANSLITGYCISLVRKKHIEKAVEILIATACFIIPLIVGMVAGTGLLLAVILFLSTFTIVRQTLSGGKANRFLFLGFAFSIITVLIDFAASWPRLSIPILQTIIPATSIVLIGILIIFMARQFREYKIRGKLVVTFVIVTLISVGALSFVANRITTAQFDQTLGTNFHELASRMAREVGDAITKSKIALDGLALNKFVQDSVVEANANGTTDVTTLLKLDQQWAKAGDNSPLIKQVVNNELSVELKEFQNRLPQYAEVFVTDRSGSVIASTHRTSDYYQADEEWWKTAWNNGTGAIYISQPVYDESVKIYAIDIALPIPSHNGKDIVGILRATVDINELTSLLTASQLGQTGQAVLALPNNRYLSNQTGVNFSTFSLVTSKGISSINGPYGQVDYEGIPSVVSSVPVTSITDKEAIDQLRWSVVVHQDLPEANKPITNTTQGLLLTAIGVLIATGLLAIFVGGQFARPIENLTAVAEQAANGNLSIKAAEQTQDEIGVLANTFNRMTSQLRETLLGLEERVSDRTHDLELASEVGQAITEKVSNISALLFEAAELIRSRFNLYYTQIYLVDAAGRNLYLRAGTGEVGQQLLRRNHHLVISPTSLNGRAGLEKHPVLVGDTQSNATCLPNPLLPLTRSELAVPLISGGAVVGVLDIQSERPDTFSNANIPAFSKFLGN